MIANDNDPHVRAYIRQMNRDMGIELPPEALRDLDNAVNGAGTKVLEEVLAILCGSFGVFDVRPTNPATFKDIGKPL